MLATMKEKRFAKGQKTIKDFFKLQKNSKNKYRESISAKSAVFTKSSNTKFDSNSELHSLNKNEIRKSFMNNDYLSSVSIKRKLNARECSYSDKESVNSHLSILLPENLASNEDKIKKRCDINISQYELSPFTSTLEPNLSVEFASSCSTKSNHSKSIEQGIEVLEDNSSINESISWLSDSYINNNMFENRECILDSPESKSSEHDVESQQHFAQLILGELLYNRDDSTLPKKNGFLVSCINEIGASSSSSPIHEIHNSTLKLNKFDGIPVDSISHSSSNYSLHMSPLADPEVPEQIRNRNAECDVGYEIKCDQFFKEDQSCNMLELEKDSSSPQDLAYAILAQNLTLSQSSQNVYNDDFAESIRENKTPFKSQEEMDDSPQVELGNAEVIEFKKSYFDILHRNCEKAKELNLETLQEKSNSHKNLSYLYLIEAKSLVGVKAKHCENNPIVVLSQEVINLEGDLKNIDVSLNNSQNKYYHEVLDLSELNRDNCESGQFKQSTEDLDFITNMLYSMDEYYLNNTNMLQEYKTVANKEVTATINWRHFLKDQENIPSSDVNVIFHKSCMEFLSCDYLIHTGDVEEELCVEERHKLVLRNIHRELNRLFQDASQNKGLYFKYKNNRCWENLIITNQMLLQRKDKHMKFTFVRKRTKSSSDKFKLMLEFLRKIFVLISNNDRITKRELYYELNQVKRKASRIYEALTAITCVLEVPLWYCNIYSTSKGLAYGDLVITIDGKDINYNRKGGTLVPTDTSIITKIVSRSLFILIVEKDTIFQKLLDEGMPNKMSQSFLLVTGKGYADMSTQLFIKKIWMHCKIPAFIIVDADPNGIEIMLTYKFGSLNLAHSSQYLALPQLRWIGVYPSELRHLNIQFKPLTERDVRKVKDLLKRPYLKLIKRLEEELRAMLDSNIKAEIEGLIKNDKYLSETYIPEKICAKDFC